MYPDPGSNRDGFYSTGVWDQRVYRFRHLGFSGAKIVHLFDIHKSFPNFITIDSPRKTSTPQTNNETRNPKKLKTWKPARTSTLFPPNSNSPLTFSIETYFQRPKTPAFYIHHIFSIDSGGFRLHLCLPGCNFAFAPYRPGHTISAPFMRYI